jgi:hypothetical protein
MTPKRLVLTTITILLTLVLATVLSAGSSHEIFLKANAESLSSCQEILTRAFDILQNSCKQLGRNKACYGNDKVKAEPRGDSNLTFEQVGDTAAIQTIQTIETSPLNLTTGAWGLSLLKLQANLPDSLPGQNVTFLVYGNTHIDNTTGDMRGFYFSSGLGTPECKETPSSGIVVKSPNHTEVTFTANGVEITIASTIKLQAEANKAMSVALIEGHAKVSTAAGAQVLQPGQSVSIPMGGTSGLSAAGAPSKPVQTRSDQAIDALIEVASRMSDPKDVGTAASDEHKPEGTRPAPQSRRNYPTYLPTNPGAGNAGGTPGNGIPGGTPGNGGSGNGNGGNGGSGTGGSGSGGNGNGGNGNGGGGGGGSGTSGGSGSGHGK